MLTDNEPKVSTLARQEFRWTERQKQVLDRLTRGWSNRQIADDLGISLDGAKWHMREILSTLGVDSREAAAEYWRRRNGLPSRFARVFGAAAQAPLRLAAAATVAAVGIAALIVVASSRGADGQQDGVPERAVSNATATVAVQQTSEQTSVDERVIQAVETGDWDLLVASIDPESVPCDSSDLSASPSCPSSTTATTPVDAIVRFHCRPVWVSVDTLLDPLTTRYPAQYQLVATDIISEPLPDDPVSALTSLSHWLVFATSDPTAPPGFAVGLSASGVRAFGTSCEGSTASLWSHLP